MKVKKYKHRLLVTILCLMVSFLLFSGPAMAFDDDIPFFHGDTGLPNVMFIFDNSDSMQACAYPRINGDILTPDWRWRYGPVIENGVIAEEDDGDVLFDRNMYSSQTAMALPGVNPPNLPGLSVPDSTMTSYYSDNNNRIYDSNLDWSLVYDWGDWVPYRYWRVKVTDADGNEQVRNLTARSTSSGYWRVNQNIDYTGTKPYTYEIMAGTPGEVTYTQTNDTRVYDRNFDWSTVVDWSDWSNTYREKIIEITEGTNAGEMRILSGRNTGYGYWYVTESFPVPCDETTRYRILGSPDDDRYARGGNHPASKLYQAKQALTILLNSNSIQTDDKYLINMGFATYMSARKSRVRAKYYRYIPGDSEWIEDQPERYYIRADYFRERDAGDRYYYHPTSNSQFVVDNFPSSDSDTGPFVDNFNHTGVSVGYTFHRLYRENQCDEQIITYRVTDISPSPTDSLPNRYRFRCRSLVSNGHGYIEHSRRNTDVAFCDTSTTPAWGDVPNISGWTKTPTTHDCYDPPECVYVEPVPGHWETTEGYYRTTYRETWGDHSIANPDTPGYIHPVTLMVTPYPGFVGTSWTVNYSPDPDNGDYTLAPVGLLLEDVCLNDTCSSRGNITSNIFDYTVFRYPADGSTERPHGWSYRRTADDYIYRRYHYNVSHWEDDIQKSPFFPAEVGDEMGNHVGDDQVVFVNLPEYNGALPSKGDDLYGDNVDRIKNYVNLARVQSPDMYSSYTSRYDYTMMPYTSSLAVNNEQQTAGAGTPLGASLAAAGQYYQSYMAQDPYSQQGCRDNFVILLTDGLETCDGDPVAAAAALLNMAEGVEGSATPVKTYVIGFGLGEDARTDLNAIAAAGGTNQAYFASNVDELVSVLRDEIIAEVLEGTYTRSSPEVSRKVLAGDERKIFFSFFDYPMWKGHLKAMVLDDQGRIERPHDNWPGECDGDDSQVDSDAGCIMANGGRGPIITTADGVTMTDFSTGNVSVLKALINPTGKDINGNGSPDEDQDAIDIIGYTLDSGYHDPDYVGSRNPQWPMGDIYHSGHVIVTPPNFVLYDTWAGYDAFKAAAAARDTVIYVGGNDGMLHAINELNGTEKWGYIPKCILDKLNEFKEGHRFTVDLTISAADMDLSDGCTGIGWKTILVSGLRRGGNYYYALDVTDPVNPVPLWEVTDDNMGQTWSVPFFGRMMVNGVPTSVVVVGGGYSSTENTGNRVYIIKASDGTILKEIEVPNSFNNVPAKILGVAFNENSAGHPFYHDGNNDVAPDELRGFVETAYFGDTNGTLWKLRDLNRTAGEGDWYTINNLEELYTPVDPQPIFHRPAVSDIQQNCPHLRRLVLFGTGEEQAPPGFSATSNTTNYFYEIEDRPFDNTPGPPQGPDFGSAWTPAEMDDGLFRENWRLVLGDQGYDGIDNDGDTDIDEPDEAGVGCNAATGERCEKMLSDPVVYRHVVYFTTYQPAGACGSGISYLYGAYTTQCGLDGTDVAGENGDDVPGKGGLLPPPSGDDDDDDDDMSLKRGPMDGIATGVTIAGGTGYFQIGKDIYPFPVPIAGGKLLYWREVD